MNDLELYNVDRWINPIQEWHPPRFQSLTFFFREPIGGGPSPSCIGFCPIIPGTLTKRSHWYLFSLFGPPYYDEGDMCFTGPNIQYVCVAPNPVWKSFVCDEPFIWNGNSSGCSSSMTYHNWIGAPPPLWEITTPWGTASQVFPFFDFWSGSYYLRLGFDPPVDDPYCVETCPTPPT